MDDHFHEKLLSQFLPFLIIISFINDSYYHGFLNDEDVVILRVNLLVSYHYYHFFHVFFTLLFPIFYVPFLSSFLGFVGFLFLKY